MSKKGTTITVLSRTIKTTIKTNKMPDIGGFIQAMKDMGGKVSTSKDGTIVIDLHQGGKVSKPGGKCPNCGAEGKYHGEHEAAVRNYKLRGQSIADFGWRCWNCGWEWGFEVQEGGDAS